MWVWPSQQRPTAEEGAYIRLRAHWFFEVLLADRRQYVDVNFVRNMQRALIARLAALE